MCFTTKQEISRRNFEELRLHLNGFYYEGMALDTLAHRLRQNATLFSSLLQPFLVEQRHDTEYHG